MGVLFCSGVLCGPELFAAPAMLNDKVGLCPRPPGAPRDEALEGSGLTWATELLLLPAAAEGASDARLDCGWLLADGLRLVFPSCASLLCAIFLKVITHSTSSPAYTLGSLHCTKAWIFDAGDGGGMVVEARARCAVAASCATCPDWSQVQDEPMSCSRECIDRMYVAQTCSCADAPQDVMAPRAPTAWSPPSFLLQTGATAIRGGTRVETRACDIVRIFLHCVQSPR